MLLMNVTDNPYLPDDNFDINHEKFLDEKIDLNGRLIDPDGGIRVAYAFDPNPVPIVSFTTDDWEVLDYIDIKNSDNDIVKIVHIATEKQIYEVHFEEILTKYITLDSANPSSHAIEIDKILPNKKITNLYLEYCKFYENRQLGRILNTGIGVTKIKEIGNMIAVYNGWKKNNRLSSINGRNVFSHMKRDNIFLSIDTEKGDFEIHSSDSDINHKGAISFDGAKFENPKSHKLRFR